MFTFTLFAALAAQSVTGIVAPETTTVEPRAAAVDFYDPRNGGGSLLNLAREPINAIISGLSSPEVLTNRGIVNFANSLAFGDECFGLHLGGPQAANLGDGNGAVNQTYMLRENFNLPIGTCLQSLVGGNHFRVFRQNGPKANSGALFLAASEEDTLANKHTIIPDGYNLGRDNLVKQTEGRKSFGGVAYTTQVRYIDGMLPAGADGVNHGISIDGRTALLTVKAEVVGSGLDCKGSSLCGSINANQCTDAKNKIVPTNIYRTDGANKETGVCSGKCGIFVQGTECRFSGASLIDAFDELRNGGGCAKCGSKRFADGCLITMNYVSSC